MAEPIPQALWPRLSAAFDAALDVPPAERTAWLAAQPPEIAQPLAAMLQAHQSEASLPSWDASAVLGARATPGQRVGPYRLVERIGEGGMAEVWGAEQVQGPLAGRRVALKLPRPGQRLSERLAEERTLLIGLEHPHIARLYDAGSEAGQPWLALEWVAGRPIDDALAGRPLRDRLIAFLQVLDAVRHAHARLVLHADLKPGNILVGDDGRVKLLDFGIARLLHAGGPHAFTPGMAAPEQRRGELLTVAADVYGLGSVLAALMPVSERGRALAAVIARAQAESPADRYADVEALAADVHRLLDHRPVAALPHARGYRLACFARRQRWPLLGLAALLLGLAAALWQGDAARREARRAEAANAYLLDLFKTLDRRAPDAAQPEAALRRLLSARASQIDAVLPDDPDTADELLRITATLHDYLGESARSKALGERRYQLLKQSLGLSHHRTQLAGMSLAWPLLAENELPATAALLAELDGAMPARGLLRAEWSLARHDLRQRQGADAVERESLLRQALALYEADAPTDSGHAAAWLALSELLASTGRRSEALVAVDRALARVVNAQPYIASDHARQLLQRASLGAPTAAADEALALSLLRGSVGLSAVFVKRPLAALVERRCASDPAAAQALATEAAVNGCPP